MYFIVLIIIGSYTAKIRAWCLWMYPAFGCRHRRVWVLKKSTNELVPWIVKCLSHKYIFSFSFSSQSGFRDLIFLYCISHLNISYFSPEAYFSAVLTNSSVTLLLHSGDRLPLWDVFRNCPGPVLPVEDKTCTSLFWVNLLSRCCNRLCACTFSLFRFWWKLLAI